ncbi:glycosyltransferase family 2 protein [Paenibacillus campinasensis]|uniref:glycosyltransferase family 2 protein n=1 Tax=Paenibacillus campinasensis TaxID=66347 RepID=UPI001E4BFD5B|nr:glycosyltransferase family 2 protein [Paenibacillus campinasensis]
MKRLNRTKKTWGRSQRQARQSRPKGSGLRRSAPKKRWQRRAWYAGYTAGRRALRRGGRLSPRAFEHWLATTGLQGLRLNSWLPELAESFRRGCARGSKGRLGTGPLPSVKARVSAVVLARNHAATITSMLQQLKQLPLHELIVVMDGSEDNSFSTARAVEGVIIIHLPEQAGLDTARALGARASTGDYVLFLNGDLPVPAPQLYRFLAAADRGVEVALNDITSQLPPFAEQTETVRCQAFLNRMLGRDDLGANALTVLPHALSRRAMDVIGYANLTVPPKALALAIQRGLRIEAVHAVDAAGRTGSGFSGQEDPGQIIGDHIEALTEVMEEQGSRLHWGQVSRQELALRRNGI